MKNFYSFILFFTTFLSYSQVSIAFSTPGTRTWTVPCQVTSITVEAWGGGGGGQPVTGSGTAAAGAGGSGGGYVKGTYGVTAGTVYNFSVGSGGTGAGGIANNGSNTWFNTAATLNAVGGNGAAAGIANGPGIAVDAPSTGNIGGTLISNYGGKGADGAVNGGGGGSSAGSSASGSATGQAGGLAPTDGYAGGNGSMTNAAAVAKAPIGAGGGGAKKGLGGANPLGGAGGDGQIRITYNYDYCVKPFVAVDPISKVNFAGINNRTDEVRNRPPSFENFCSIAATVMQGVTYPIVLEGNTDGNWTDYITVFIDWNQNKSFGDAGEKYDIGGITNSTGVDGITLTGNIIVPAGAVLGSTRMHVIKRGAGDPDDACTGGADGQTEAYTVNVTAPVNCPTPNAPADLSFFATTTTSSGTFTPVSATGYLVLRRTAATVPSPVNGTTYTAGNMIGTATVVSSSAGPTISDSGLTPGTRYYYFIYAYNTGTCAGAPVYSLAPLQGNVTTCPLAPTANTVSAITQNAATISWAPPTGGPAVFTYTVEVSPNSSFAPQNSGSPFTGIGATTVNITGLIADTSYYYRIKATNGCDSEWLNGSFKTLCATPLVPGGLSLTRSGGTVTGTFSAPITVPSGYLIVRSASATAPAFTNGTAYNTGATVAGNYIVRGSSTPVNAVTFTDVPAGYVYYYVYSFNSGCAGGPIYTSPVSARINACAPSSNSNARYISEVKFLGTLNPDTSNVSDFTAGGYHDYTILTQKAKQIPGGVINLNVNLKGSANPPTAFIKAWVDWDRDDIFNTVSNATPGGEKVFDTSDNGVLAPNVIFGFVVPPGTAPGFYIIRVRTSTVAGTSPCGNATDGETEDYTFEVIADCAAKVTAVAAAERCGSGSVTLSATGSPGTTGYRWYSTEFGAPIAGATSASYTVPNLAVGKHTYYVTALNGTCESAYRTPVKITVRPTPEITFTQNAPDFCGTANTVLISSTGNKEEVTLLEDKFENGGAKSLVFDNVSEGNTNADAIWQLRNSPFVPAAPYNVVKAALSSGFNGGNFANIITDVRQTTSIFNHFVTKNAINTTGITDLKLDYDLYYFSEEDLISKNYLKLQYSIDNGVSWVDLKTYISDVGVPSRFESVTETLPKILENQTQLKFRFSVFALGSAQANGSVLEWIVDVVGLDNVRLYGDKDLPATFVWSGVGGELLDSTCTVPVAPGGSPSVCVRLSDAELENRAQVSITASAALSNGCSASGTMTVLNSNKVWNYPSTDWAAANWKPVASVPTASNCVIVKQPVIIGVSTQGFAKNLTVRPGGTLNIKGSLKVTDAVVNGAGAADVVVESDASLIQLNEGNNINTGNITAKRSVSVSAGRQQYNYLISPLEGQSLKTIYPGIDFVLYHNEANNFFYNSSGAYIKGRALAVKEPKSSALPDGKSTSVTATFTGYPTNGAFTYGLVNSNPANVNRGYNLVGNPYPSNMDLNEFYRINGGTAGTLNSSFHLWDNRANSQTVQMGDKYLGQAYAIFNAVAPPGEGTGTLATGDEGLPGTNRPTRYIKAGQGFMVKTSAPAQQLIFNNTVRTDKSGPAFFGKNAPAASQTDRYWLNMINAENLASEMAVVYFDGGNNAFTMDDSRSLGGSDEVYSVLENEKININGRGTFADSDVVPLGTRHFAAGAYRIKLAGAEGIFADGQVIYLKDKLNGVVTNLTEGAYSFSANAGESTGRFEIVYRPAGVLDAGGVVKDLLTVYRDQGDFVLVSKGKKISAVQVFDAAGRLVYGLKPNSEQLVISSAGWADGVYILKIDRSGEMTSRKIIK